MVGKSYGYYPNASETHLIVNFVCGQRHLGAAIGSSIHIQQYGNDEVQTWVQEIRCLSDIATSQPHAAYAVHGVSSYWNFLSRTIPHISRLYQPLENVIHQVFIPSLTGHPHCL